MEKRAVDWLIKTQAAAQLPQDKVPELCNHLEMLVLTVKSP